MLMSLDLPEGLYRNGTRYQSQGNWYDSDLIRWPVGTMQPIGGWRQKTSDAVSGMARCVHTWVDDSNQSWCAVSTNEGLFVYTRSGILHNITPAEFIAGPANASTGGGYGRGPYGAGLYGTPRPDTTNVIPAMVWTLDNIGQVLVACDGVNIYEWDLNVANVATIIPNSPTALAVFVTDERSIMALGAAGNPRRVMWSDSENYDVWTPSSTNLAGGYNLQSPGTLQCGKRIGGGYLIFTDSDVYLSTFVNLPDVYGFERIGTSCGVASKQSVGIVDGRAYWWGIGRLWQYNGIVTPLECSVEDDLFRVINAGQASKVNAFRVSEFSELSWVWPDNTSIECNRYLTYNYETGRFWWGRLNRTCGTDRSGGFAYPLMMTTDGILMEHEVGNLRDGREPYALSGPVELSQGEATMSVYGIIPDELNLGDATVSFTTGDWTMSPDGAMGPYALADKTDVRFNARRISVKLTGEANKDFRFGRFRFNAKTGPRR